MLHIEDLEEGDRVFDPDQKPHWGVVTHATETGVKIVWKTAKVTSTPDYYGFGGTLRMDTESWVRFQNPFDLRDVP